MTPRIRWTPRGRRDALPGSLLLLLGILAIGLTPLAATGFSIYESAQPGPLAVSSDPPPVIVANQVLGVKFHVSKPVTTGSIGGYFAPYSAGVENLPGQGFRIEVEDAEKGAPATPVLKADPKFPGMGGYAKRAAVISDIRNLEKM